MSDETPHPVLERGDAGQFLPGVSGNPAEKVKGTRNATTRALEQLLDDDAQEITRTCIELAKAGDKHALKIVMERLLPVRRGRPVEFDLPEVEGVADVTRAHGALLRACATGTLTPEEGALLAGVVDAKRRSIELEEVTRRLDALERTAADRSDR